VNGIQAPDSQDIPFDPKQIYLSDPDGVGSAGASKGEYAAPGSAGVPPRVLEKLVPLGKVELENHQDPVFLLQVLESWNELWVEDDTGLSRPHGVAGSSLGKVVLHPADGGE